MDGADGPRVAVRWGVELEPGRLEDPTEGDDALARVLADEAAATAARLRFRRGPLPVLSPDDRIAPLLEDGERILALRREALVDRREPSAGRWWSPGVQGDLYVTSRRLIMLGRVTLTFELGAVEDALVSGERLLLVLAGGRGVMVEAPCPRLLWAEITAARAQEAGSGPARARPGGVQPAVR